MSQTIDVTGLPAESVRVVESLVSLLRSAGPVAVTPQTDPEAWSAALRRWAETHPKRDIVIDDSRETIYEGCGE
jgi:hypothetical protein